MSDRWKLIVALLPFLSISAAWSQGGSPAFAVGGSVKHMGGQLLEDGVQIEVENQTRQLKEKTKVGENTQSGKYAISFLTTKQGAVVVKEGDVLTFSVGGKQVSPEEYKVIVEDVSHGFVKVDLIISQVTKLKLAGDVNGDNSVNIFDLVMVAGQFGKSGAGLSGDVNSDSSVNIFDLVMVAGNFGKSAVAAAPTILARALTFTTQQKWSIQSAIVELEDMPVRSEAEELVFRLLIAILPERLLEQTQLLPNYPNPFNPETWIPFELSQDSEVSVTIYDVSGTQVRNVSVGYLQAGSYVSQSRAIYWDGKTDAGERVASGTYFYTLTTQDYTFTQKMIVLK